MCEAGATEHSGGERGATRAGQSQTVTGFPNGLSLSPAVRSEVGLGEAFGLSGPSLLFLPFPCSASSPPLPHLCASGDFGVPPITPSTGPCAFVCYHCCSGLIRCPFHSQTAVKLGSDSPVIDQGYGDNNQRFSWIEKNRNCSRRSHSGQRHFSQSQSQSLSVQSRLTTVACRLSDSSSRSDEICSASPCQCRTAPHQLTVARSPHPLL